jgi:hypothetical protein
MGNKSGIKWNGVSEGTQSTLDVIGTDLQLIVRDPKTQQEWVTTSQDYANFLVDNNIISSSGWGLSGNSGTDPLTNFIGTTDNQDFIIQPDTGNVGVGTTTPFVKFHVQGQTILTNTPDILASPLIQLTNTRGRVVYIDTDNADYNGLLVENKQNYIYGCNNTDITQGTLLSLAVNDGTGGTTERVTFLNNGNVGIGTATPASKLTVDTGDIEVIGDTNGLILESPDATRYKVTVANGGTLTVTAV